MDIDPFDLIGDVLDGQFRVDTFVGEGDLSVVYKGHHLGLDAPVAIKCLNLPATLDGALVRPLVNGFTEAGRVHYRLARRNLNIAQSIASGTTLAPRTGAPVPYLVREWFEGESLASELARRRTEKRTGRSPEEAIALLEPVFDGVGFAHSQAVAHLSLNPSNLFLAARGEGDRASLKVLDFGMARTMNDLVAGVAVAPGSTAGLRVLVPAYAAPEQLDKKVGSLGPWTDVYALALVMMELLSDRVVMSETETGALVERALDEKRRPTPQAHGLKLPRPLELALSRALSMRPEQRQKSAEELWKAVKPDLRAKFAPPSQRPSTPTLLGMTPFVPRVAVALPVRAKLASSPRSAKTQPMAFKTPAMSDRGSVAAPTAIPALAPTPASAPVPSHAASEASAPAPSRAPTDPLAPASALALQPSLAPALAPAPPPSTPAPVLAPALSLRAAHDSITALASVLPAAPAASDVSTDSPSTAEHAPPADRPAWRHWVAQLQTFNRRQVRVVAIGCAAASAAVVVSAAALLGAHRQPPVAPAVAAPPPPTPPLPHPPAVAEPAEPEPTAGFSQAVAWRALYATSGEVARCRRGVWGGTTATVIFANDGAVSNVDFRRPFRGSPTATCVAEVLESVHIAPFAGKPGAIAFWFYVATPTTRARR